MDEALTEERTVEVLLRVQPEDPWKWYPGILDTFGLVSVTLPDRELKGFVVEQRIRSDEEDLDELLVKKERFSRKHVVVPSEPGVAVPSDDQLMTIFNGHCRQRHYWMMATHVLNNPCHGLFKELAVLGMFGGVDSDDDSDYECDEDDFEKVDELNWPQHHGIRKVCCQSLDALLLSLVSAGADTTGSAHSLFPAASYSDVDIQSLYRDPTIFPQIFECLTTVQQTKRRGVCRTWDAILTSACIRRVLIVSQPRYGRNYTRHVYRFAACLYHCWTKDTRMLVLYGGKSPSACEGVLLDDTAWLLQRLRTDKGLPAVEALLLAREWQLQIEAANWVNGLREVLVSLAGVCHQVLLKNVSINLELQPAYPYSPDSIVVCFSKQRITQQLTVNGFWTMLNDGLCDVDSKDVERLAEWISRTTGKMVIAGILNITQVLDTRDGVHYRGMKFRRNLDGVNVRHLTKLTQHALLQRFDGSDRTFRLQI